MFREKRCDLRLRSNSQLEACLPCPGVPCFVSCVPRYVWAVINIIYILKGITFTEQVFQQIVLCGEISDGTSIARGSSTHTSPILANGDDPAIGIYIHLPGHLNVINETRFCRPALGATESGFDFWIHTCEWVCESRCCIRIHSSSGAAYGCPMDGGVYYMLCRLAQVPFNPRVLFNLRIVSKTPILSRGTPREMQSIQSIFP